MLERNLFLIGLPGCGKTSLGKRAARECNVRFTDLDLYIENAAGMKIPEIFEKYGEEKFRTMETNALIRMTRQYPGLVSVGGGTPMTPVNRKIMQAWGSVIMIDRNVDEILSDLRTENRPLLQGNTEEQMRAIAEERLPVYRAFADVVIPNKKGYADTLNLLMRVMKERYRA